LLARQSLFWEAQYAGVVQTLTMSDLDGRLPSCGSSESTVSRDSHTALPFEEVQAQAWVKARNSLTFCALYLLLSEVTMIHIETVVGVWGKANLYSIEADSTTSACSCY
jgi:hypothetical protein